MDGSLFLFIQQQQLFSVSDEIYLFKGTFKTPFTVSLVWMWTSRIYIYIYIYIYIKLSRNPSARWARHVLTTPDPEERVVSRRNFRSFVALRIADLGAMIQLSYFIPVRQWTCPSGSLNYSVNCCFRRRCWRGFFLQIFRPHCSHDARVAQVLLMYTDQHYVFQRLTEPLSVRHTTDKACGTLYCCVIKKHSADWPCITHFVFLYGPWLKIHSVLLVTDYRSTRIFYYAVVSCMLKTVRYIIKIRVKLAVLKSI